MLTNRVQEGVELSDVDTVMVPTGQLGMQLSKVAFQHAPVEVGQPGDADGLAEAGESGQRSQAAAHGLQVQSGA